MKRESGSDEAKQSAGESAAQLVEDGMVVGLGTGSTTAYAIKELGERLVEEELDVQGLPTSYESRHLAIEEGIPITSLDESVPDLAIDGADQFNDRLELVKGGGAAHAREKAVASSAEQVVIVVDESKYAEELNIPVPVEVLGFARKHVEKELSGLGSDVVLRDGSGKDGPVVTDNGNLVLDADFGVIDDPGRLGGVIAQIPGVVDHGLFVGIADEVHVGGEEGVNVRQ